MKRLFTSAPGERYTERARQLDGAVHDALKPILDEVFAEGYSTRDVEALLYWTVGEMCVTRRLTREMEAANDKG